MSLLGLAWDVQAVPSRIYEEAIGKRSLGTISIVNNVQTILSKHGEKVVS